MTQTKTGPLFTTGKSTISPGVAALCGMRKAKRLFRRHRAGDWGNLGKFDRDNNDMAVSEGRAILSSYLFGSKQAGRRVWIITSADRSRTRVILPEEY